MMIARAVPIPPRWIATWKTRNLAQKPARGGMPASDTMNTVIATAITGARRERPAKSVISRPRDSLAIAITTANAPRVMTA